MHRKNEIDMHYVEIESKVLTKEEEYVIL